MKTAYSAALIGCGDYLRWETEKLQASSHLKVKYTYDTDNNKSLRIAKQLGASAVGSPADIFFDETIDVVLIFTPPFAREEYFRIAAEKGKHIITTKPLASNYEDAKKLADITRDKVKCSVFYGRTGDAATDTLHTIFNSGEIGKLAVYKEDWFHHFPTWNKWATESDKNGGPFMDAMIHNLNKSRYLIGSEVENVYFRSENYAQQLDCNDTEFMNIYFKNGSVAYLFITWAADLPVYDPSGNDREHIGIYHMITDKGWYVTIDEDSPEPKIRARKNDRKKEWPLISNQLTPYDDFALQIQNGNSLSFDIQDALVDIRILSEAVK